MYRVLILLICVLTIAAYKDDHHDFKNFIHKRPTADNDENSAKFWNTKAKNTLKERLSKTPNTNIAKNVILFMGDGMSIPTLTATRIYMGGENVQLSFEKFPHTAVSKTYCVNYQVPDSACTATAYLGGVKANLGTVGVTANVQWEDCESMTNTSNHVQSIAQWAQAKGKATGLVTTARVTHASPAGVFGHTSERTWETDTDIINSQEDSTVCMDLATQLVTAEVGSKLNVIMGGGRYAFLPNNTKGDEGDYGYRSDGVNLIDKWKELKKDHKASYIWNREQLLQIDDVDYVLGLFESDHCPYYLERDTNLDPTLTEMTEAAIKILSKNSEGYFLFVEGARIDMAHHQTMAHLALEETVEFSKAVERAINITSTEDTLIVVTADHAHTMSIGGYPLRGNNILHIAGSDKEDLPFTTLNYAGGPGYKPQNNDGSRHDVGDDNLDDIEYRYPTGYPLDSETHGGDDVLVFAQGPWSHLFHGVIEQNVIPHLMAYASCIGADDSGACYQENSSRGVTCSVVVLLFLIHFFL